MSDSFSNGSAPGIRREFVTTQRSVILRAQRDGAEGQEALNALCRTYWPPLLDFARRDGLSPHNSEDAVQGFIALLLARQDLNSVGPEKERFRSFLLTAFKHFLTSRARGEHAIRCGGGVTAIHLDGETIEAIQAPESGDNPSSDKAFDRAWARHPVARILLRPGFAGGRRCCLCDQVMGE